MGGKQHPSSEQMHFSAEDSTVKSPVPIPENVLTILRNEDTIRGALEDQSISPKDLPSSWFLASETHLSNANRPDLVVIGQPPVSGGSVAIFWVFFAKPSGYKLVLTAPAHDLTVRNTCSKGLRDIELTNLTAMEVWTVLLRFNGERYVKSTVTSNPIQ
jgi:hypothetical protein